MNNLDDLLHFFQLKKPINLKYYMKLSNIISSCEILQNIAKDILKCIFKNNT